jgi:uncharacterized protein
MTAITPWVKKHPLAAFYLLAFGLTWLGWVPQALYSRGLFPFDSPFFFVLGGLGPLLAVFIVHRITTGSADFGELFIPLFNWRSGPGWYAAALLGAPVMWIATIFLAGVMQPELSRLDSPAALTTSFVIFLIAAIPEEMAWRGYALPRLQARHNALFSSLIVGGLWGLWHLPLLLNLNNHMSTYAIGLYLVDTVGLAFLFTWLFNNTRGSLLFVVIFHAAVNTIGSFIGYENLIVTYIVVAVLIVLFGPEDLNRRGERVEIRDPLAEEA